MTIPRTRGGAGGDASEAEGARPPKPARGAFAVPPALAEYRRWLGSAGSDGPPAPLAAEISRLGRDPRAFVKAVSPSRLPAGRIPPAARGDARGDARAEAAETVHEDAAAPGSPLGSMWRAETNAAVFRLRQGRVALTPGTLGAAGRGSAAVGAFAREALAESVVERARVLVGFDDPAEAFSRRHAPPGQRLGRRGHDPGRGAPWEASQKVAGGAAAPFVFVAGEAGLLWRAGLALAGAEPPPAPGASPGAVSGSDHAALAVGIGGPDEAAPALGAAPLRHLLASVIRGLEAPYRAGRAARDGRQGSRPGERPAERQGERGAAQRAPGLSRPGDKFPGQARWERARADFAEAQKSLREAMRGPRRLEEALAGLEDLVRGADEANSAEEDTRDELHERDAELARAERELASADEDLDRADRALAAHAGRKPGLARRLFSAEAERRWILEGRRLQRLLDDRLVAAEEAEAVADAAEDGQRRARARLSAAVRDERNARKNRDEATRQIEEWTARLGPAAPDPALYSADERAAREALRRAAASPHEPYLHPEVEAAREGVFRSALAVHRAFALVAARPVSENLRVLLAGLEEDPAPVPPALSAPEGRPDPAQRRQAQEKPNEAARRASNRDLLAALSLVAPATGLLLPGGPSRSLLGPLGREGAGWLLAFAPEGDAKGPGGGAAEVEGAVYRARRAALLPPV